MTLLSETHLRRSQGSAAEDVSDHIGARLNWRSLRMASKTAGALPEYDACVAHSLAEEDDKYAGVLFAWDPQRVELLEKQELFPGRVLRLRIRMLDDLMCYDVFACYMPQQGLSIAYHKRVWMALLDAVSVADPSCLVIGDLNAETTDRLKKHHGIDIRKGTPGKRPGEGFLLKLMSDGLVESGPLTRVGKELYTSRRVIAAGDTDEADTTASHVIDHVLAGMGASRVSPAGTHVVQSDKKHFHRAVACFITTVSISKVVTDSKLKPKLGRMPPQPLPQKSKALPLAKRAVQRAREIPLPPERDDGELADDVEMEASDAELDDPAEAEGPGEPIGWAAYRDRVVDAVTEDLKDYVCRRGLARKEATTKLLEGGAHPDPDEVSKVIRESDRVFQLEHGTGVNVLMSTSTANRTCREVINEPASSGARRRTKREELRRLLNYYLGMEQTVEELPAMRVYFDDTGQPRVRQRIVKTISHEEDV